MSRLSHGNLWNLQRGRPQFRAFDTVCQAMSGLVRPQFMILVPGWAVQSGFPIDWFGLPTTGAEALRGRRAVCGFVLGCLQILGAVLQ
jgi:hypothetical protein